MNASDGRHISVYYNAQGHVDSVSDGSRTWYYQYSYPTATTGTLTAVILPDGSQWSINFGALSTAKIRYEQGQPGAEDPVRSCGDPGYIITPGATGTITHPSGATGEFSVEPLRHGRSNVPMICANYSTPYNDNNDDVAYLPVVYDAFSLVKKRVTGPGLAAAEWNYGYGADAFFAPGTGPVCYSSSCMEPVCLSDACAGSSVTVVAGPANQWVRYTFGNSYRYNEGKLLKVERGTGPTDIRRVDTTTYELAQGGQAYATPIGTSPQPRGDGFTSEHLRPQKVMVIAQDGATFNSQVSSFDAYARPLSVRKWASFGGAANDKTEVTEYHDNLSYWVLGQVRKLTVNGVVARENSYDAATVTLLTQKAFGKLTQTLTYSTDGTVATAKDGNNNVTTLSSWKRGIPQSIKYADSTIESAMVNDQGLISSVNDENGHKTCYAYDTMGRLASVTYPSETTAGTCATTAWNATTQTFAAVAAAEYGIPAGHWKQTISTGNARTVRYFDALWRPLVEETFDNANKAATLSQTVKGYDPKGHVAFQSYPINTLSNYATVTQGTRNSYDALDRLGRVEQDSELGVLVTTTSYLNNASGPYTLSTNPRGQQTRTWFQAFDQPDLSNPVTISHPEGAYTDIVRDVFSKPKSLTRRNSTGSLALTRSYVYDANQQLCKTIEPETGATVMHYDAAGNLDWSAAGLALSSTSSCDTTHTSVAARKVVRTYDARNRVKTLGFPDGLGDSTYAYTPDGLQDDVTVDNGSGNVVTTSYTYNARRLPTGESMAWNAILWSLTYGYDANAHLASQGYPGGLLVDYAPNALGQPTKAGTYASNVSYFPNGAIKQFTYGNGIVHTLTQNARQLPDTSRDAYGAAEFLDDGYDYDGNGNVAAISDGLAGARGNRTMTYDGLDRLKTTVSPMFDGTTASYTYDVLDNLTRVVAPGRDHYYCYDGSWRLTNVKTGSCGGSTVIGLGYDVQGNLNDKNGTTYTFDYGNRLRATHGPDSSYVYDGLGRRVRDYTTASKYSLYSQAGQLVYSSDGRKNLRDWYVYLGGSLVAIREWDVTPNVVTIKYQHTDALGSPVAVTDGSRNVIERSEYEPYGKLLNRPVTDGPGYTGHVMDAATGLAYMQQRYYDPSIGRFLSADPVTADGNTGANFNAYWYANNNPYRFTDPDGRKPRPDPGAAYVGEGISGVNVMNAVAFATMPSHQKASGGNVSVGKVSKQLGQQEQIDRVIEKYGINTNGVSVDYDPGLTGADGTPSPSGDQVSIGPGAFRFGTDSYLGAAIGHEIKHALQFQQGRDSVTTYGAAANEAEAYLYNIRNFKRFGNTPAERAHLTSQFHVYYDNLPQKYKDLVNSNYGADP